MPADAIFRINSMTKPIVTVAALRLIEQNKLRLDDALTKYLPGFGKAGVAVASGKRLKTVPLTRPITIRGLLRHTSGIPYASTAPGELQILREGQP
jgi:CubicO group peptidase (beta-lactamase class C family)